MAIAPFKSQFIADVGISMGDEGKGRLIPEAISDLQKFTGKEDPVGIVLKVNGGANSGHTCGGLKLNLFPGAVIEKSVPYLGIGAGVVADPLKFRWESAYIEKHGYEVKSRLLIDERCMVSDITHRLLDLAWEDYRVNILKEEKRGSTGRGISPSYTDETSHFQIHYSIFRGNKESFRQKLSARIDRALRTIKYVCQIHEETWLGFFDTLSQAESRANAETLEAGIFNVEEFDFHRFRGSKPFTLNLDAITESYWDAGNAWRENIQDLREIVLKTASDGKYIIGEFGQSFWLDKRIGFSPNLTASHTYVPEFFQSAGVPIQPIHTIGVCKAYDTKVGTHVFISEFPESHPLGSILRKIEFGTSTGRQRMVGWFDAVEKGDALRYGGYDELMINKLDALSYNAEKGWIGDKLLICVGYKTKNGKLIKHVPRDPSIHKTLRPIFIQTPGWEEDISNIRNFKDLPKNAKLYIAKLYQSIIEIAYEGVSQPKELPNLRYIGVGPDPSQIIHDAPEAEILMNWK